MYMVFLLSPLIHERQFLVISESMCTLDHVLLVNRLEDLSLSARRSGVGRTFKCIPGNHLSRISQSDLLLHARIRYNPKPILAYIPVMLSRCNLLISHKPTHFRSCSALSNGMKSQNLPTCSRDEFWSVPGDEMMHSGDVRSPRSRSHSRSLYD